jgi:DNA helicase-2/ATP-dependent DNA helicase PcrA
MEEERRLFYVALTRAKRHLFLTQAEHRRINGHSQPRQLSPFLKDIQNRYKCFSGKDILKKEKPSQEQLSLF